MSLRHVIVCVLCLLAACSSDDGAGLGTADAAMESGQTLEFVAGAETGVLPNDTTQLVVRYHDSLGGSVANMQIDFVLTGLALGASLSPATVFTDAQGMAGTTLRAGSTVGDLQVRARTANGHSQTLKVTVGEALGAQVAVSVSYAGKRNVASYTVTSLPGMTCEAALKSGLAGQVSFTFPSNKVEAVSFDLGSGLSAAFVGFGRDAEGSKLAAGCKELEAPITADRAMARSTLVLPLSDQPLRLDDELAVELQLNVAGSAKRMADTVASSVDAVLTPKGGYTMFAEADFYLDAVASSLSALGNTAGLSALADKRAASTLAASLASTMMTAGVGPRAVAGKVGALLTTRGAGITLVSTYETGTLGAISALRALSVDGSQLVDLPLRPPATIVGSFSPELAQLRIDSLRIDLPLGSYGVELLAALAAEAVGGVDLPPPPPATAPTDIDGAAGCSSVFGPWWSQNDLLGVSDQATAIAACQAALETLKARIETDLRGLDQSSASVSLTGSVQVQDRSEEGQVDDLGLSNLSGSWGVDAALGELRVPVRTAFAR
jgi:hypothetical protein